MPGGQGHNYHCLAVLLQFVSLQGEKEIDILVLLGYDTAQYYRKDMMFWISFRY